MRIVGVDPGNSGAFALLIGKDAVFRPMPLERRGKDDEISFIGVQRVLAELRPDHVFVERAKPLAMGSRHAFNYGKGFRTVELAIELGRHPVTLVEAHAWSKVMLEGIAPDLRPKARNWLAVQRLLPHLVEHIPVGPRSRKPHDGVIDALLIAEYGRRRLRFPEPISVDDF